jgi:large subunit ribosomal protein L25
VSNLGLNEMIYMSDLKLPAGVEIPELAQGEGHDHAVVSIHVIKAATIEEGEGAVAPSEVPTAGAEKAGDSSES